MDNIPSLPEEEKTVVTAEAETAQDNTPAAAETAAPAGAAASDAKTSAKKNEKKKHMTRAEKKQAKRERKARWKAKKKARRAELVSYYSDAPWIVRFIRLYGLRVLAIALAVAVVISIPALIETLKAPIKLAMAYMSRNEPVSKEEIYELSPLDEKGAAEIEALPAGNADDTWAVYVYLVGADLEDLGQDSLSDLVRVTSSKQKEELNELALEKSAKLLENYLSELEKNGLEPPMFLYEPKDYIQPAASEPRPYTATRPGAASKDFGEMSVEDKSGKLTVVVQTGGARKWNSQIINPNRTQRFCISGGKVNEEESFPLQRASDPGVLADFLKYCKEKHPAQHTILVLWDHGSGPFGYGSDRVFGGRLSIADVRNALDKVYDPDIESPPFDIIGYDACLMANLDVMHSLEGFSKYYVLSEESEPGDGWHYTPWLTEISGHPETNPAQIARMIVDTYTDFYMKDNVTYKGTDMPTKTVTMSLLDAKKGAGLYDAYCELARTQLIDSVYDISVLAAIGRAGNHSTCYANSGYNVYNLIDLGNYIDNLADVYPDQCAKLGKLLDETVMYHRENGSLCDSTGVSIYLPAFINSYSGTISLLDYVYNICEDENIKTLYYYKTAGCLTNEMKAYVRSMTNSEPQTLNTELFNEFTSAVPVIDGNKFSVAVNPGIKNMITSYYILQASIDVGTQSLVYYGMDALAETDADRNITSGKYDGRWICLDDQPLSPEIISSTASTVEYRAKVIKDSVPVYLIFSYDRKSGTFTIDGTKPYTSEESEYEFINMKVNSESIVDSTIVPVYEALSDGSANVFEREGNPVKCSENTRITRRALSDDTYVVGAVITDQRGDEYCSEILLCDIAGGKLSGFCSYEEFTEDE